MSDAVIILLGEIYNQGSKYRKKSLVICFIYNCSVASQLSEL